MVVDSGLSDDQVDQIFRALADRTRRDILRRSLRQEASVTELAASYDMSFAAIQKHVCVLEQAGLVDKSTHGRERLVQGNAEAIRKACTLLGSYQQIWVDRTNRLDDLFAAETS